MPYLILLIGLVLAVFGLYRFFLKARPDEIKAFFLSAGAILIALAALFLALTGRLPAAIGILVALWPIGVSYIRNKKLYEPGTAPLTEKEAYDVLGLEPGASPEDIKEAHLRLMKKVHPDQKGSDWLAKKINAARDLLLPS